MNVKKTKSSKKIVLKITMSMTGICPSNRKLGPGNYARLSTHPDLHVRGNMLDRDHSFFELQEGRGTCTGKFDQNTFHQQNRSVAVTLGRALNFLRSSVALSSCGHTLGTWGAVALCFILASHSEIPGT